MAERCGRLSNLLKEKQAPRPVAAAKASCHRACGVWQRTGAVGACIEKVVNYWHAYNEKLLVMFLNQTRASIN
jgi:hypothetical protein